MSGQDSPIGVSSNIYAILEQEKINEGSFSLYPLNEYVLLNTDEVAQVVEVNRGKLSRPVVKILYDTQGKPLDKPKTTDLARNLSLFITKAIPYHELLPAG